MADWPETPCVQCGTRMWLYARECPGCKVEIWDHFYKVTSPEGQTWNMPIKGLWHHAAPGGMETLTYLNEATNQHEPVFDGRPIEHGRHVLVHYSRQHEIEVQDFPTPPVLGLPPAAPVAEPQAKRRPRRPKSKDAAIAVLRAWTRLAQWGNTDKKLAEELGVTARTIINYKNKYKDFASALHGYRQHSVYDEPPDWGLLEKWRLLAEPAWRLVASRGS